MVVSMELWDVYDAKRNKTGKTMVRGDTFAEGTYHLVVHVCVFNTKGELLLQHRQTFKSGFPNLWDITVGGSALCGEESYQAAEREAMEEMGIPLDLKNVRPQVTVSFHNAFDDVYVVEKDLELGDLRFQYEEVQGAKWATREEIYELMEQGAFVPYCKGFIDWVFDSRRCDGFFLME